MTDCSRSRLEPSNGKLGRSNASSGPHSEVGRTNGSWRSRSEEPGSELHEELCACAILGKTGYDADVAAAAPVLRAALEQVSKHAGVRFSQMNRRCRP